jgi:hypothetical protein
VRRAAALALALCAATAPGCATLAMLRPLPRACAGPLVPVGEMGADFALRAGYRVRSRGREEALTLVAEKREGRLVLVGLDPLGTPVFALVQEGLRVRRERHLRPLFPFAPENALRDLHQVRFGERLGRIREAEAAQVVEEAGRFAISRPACDWEATLTPQSRPAGPPPGAIQRP